MAASLAFGRTPARPSRGEEVASVGCSFASVPGRFGIRPCLYVGRLDAEAGHDGADLLAVCIAVMERLDDQHALFGFVCPLIQDDERGCLERLGEEPLPNLGVFIGAPFQLVEGVGVVFVVDPFGSVG
jgi:hypothetical protein